MLIVVVLVGLLLVYTVLFSLNVYGSLSYTSWYQVQASGQIDIHGTAQTVNLDVILVFDSDGPFSVGHPIELYSANAGGGGWRSGANVSLLVTEGPAFSGYWQVNMSEVPTSFGPWGAYTLHSGDQTPFTEGLVNFTILVRLLQGALLYGGGSLQPPPAAPRLVIAPPQSWSQYDALRVTVAVSVATLILVGLPTGFKTIRDLVWPTVREWWRALHRPRI